MLAEILVYQRSTGLASPDFMDRALHQMQWDLLVLLLACWNVLLTLLVDTLLLVTAMLLLLLLWFCWRVRPLLVSVPLTAAGVVLLPLVVVSVFGLRPAAAVAVWARRVLLRHGRDGLLVGVPLLLGLLLLGLLPAGLKPVPGGLLVAAAASGVLLGLLLLLAGLLLLLRWRMTKRTLARRPAGAFVMLANDEFKPSIDKLLRYANLLRQVRRSWGGWWDRPATATILHLVSAGRGRVAHVVEAPDFLAGQLKSAFGKLGEDVQLVPVPEAARKHGLKLPEHLMDRWAPGWRDEVQVASAGDRAA